MGRELKRVPLDFDWPLNKTWEGFLNPHYRRCPGNGTTCFNGSTAGGVWLDRIARLIAMVGDEAVDAPRASELRARGRIYPHPYLEEWGQAPRTEIPDEVHDEIRKHDDQSTRFRMIERYVRQHPPQLLPLTAELIPLVEGLSGEKAGGFGGGSSYGVYVALIKAAGLDRETWGVCPICHGEGIDPAAKEAYDAWEPAEPPTGEGYQLWETTSEGSPISPVFATLDELCAYAADNCTAFGSEKVTAQEWRKMLDADFVCHREGNAVFV